MVIRGTSPVVGLVLLLTAVAGCGGDPAPGAGPGEPAPAEYGADPAERPSLGPEPCFAPGLRVEPRVTEAAMGLRAFTVALVNCGTEPVRLEGYPAAAILDDAGAPLAVEFNEGLTVTHLDSEPAVAPVTIEPGEEASTALFWRNLQTSYEAPLNGSSLTITPGPGHRPQTVPVHIDLGDTGVVDLYPWHLSEPPPPGGEG
jgi:hypothetical protein